MWVRVVLLVVLFFTLIVNGTVAQTPPTATDVLVGVKVPMGDTPYPITLATVLKLADAQPLDVALAQQQVELATRHWDKAKLWWAPNIVLGADYFRHEGGQQNFAGEILRSSRGSFAVGVGPNLVFNTSDACYGPLAARQDLLARQSFRQAVMNDTTYLAADTYFALLNARGDLQAAELALKYAKELSRKTQALTEGLAAPLEATRARVELARREQSASLARERWRVASAELVRLLRLAPGVTLDPAEPLDFNITLIDANRTPEELVPIALTHRPELAGQQAIVQATLTRLKQEKLRPLVPSLAITATSTNPSGSIAYGAFGGGANNRIGDVGSRMDLDAQLLWEFSNLGLGNRVKVSEKRTEHLTATLELFRAQDRVAAEVVTAHAKLTGARERVAFATTALKDAEELASKSLDALSQTRRVGDVIVLIVRPQEAVAAVQALAVAQADYHAAVAEQNRSQFRLYRALGHPAAQLGLTIKE